MSQDLLAEASIIISILADLKQSLETNTVDVNYYANRVDTELSQNVKNILLNASDSQDIINSFMPLFQLVLDPSIIIFYQQPVVLQWLDLILNTFKKSLSP